MVNFGSVITAMITPFNQDGSVNYEEVEKLSIWLIKNGTDSLVVCGTTGEYLFSVHPSISRIYYSKLPKRHVRTFPVHLLL